LDLLEKVEEETRTQQHDAVLDDPDKATKDDILPSGFRVVRRLGKGATSIGLLVEEDTADGNVETYILKVAADPEYNDRVFEEAKVLRRLPHANSEQAAKLRDLARSHIAEKQWVEVEKESDPVEKGKLAEAYRGQEHRDVAHRLTTAGKQELNRRAYTTWLDPIESKSKQDSLAASVAQRTQRRLRRPLDGRLL